MTTPLLIGNVGPMGIILIAVVVLVLFGRGKVSSLMGEVGKGELEQAAADEAVDVTPVEKKDEA